MASKPGIKKSAAKKSQRNKSAAKEAPAAQGADKKSAAKKRPSKKTAAKKTAAKSTADLTVSNKPKKNMSAEKVGAKLKKLAREPEPAINLKVSAPGKSDSTAKLTSAKSTPVKQATGAVSATDSSPSARWSVAALKAHARASGLVGSSRLTKAELLALLAD